MKLSHSYLIFLIVFNLTGCTINKQAKQMMNISVPLVIYKTRADYRNNVPVVLNDTKDRIISYPAPGDLTYEGNTAKPTQLTNGYVLDNMGIGKNSAFTSYTFEEYSTLKNAPPSQVLMGHIIDSDPFTELWFCGNRSAIKSVDELNALIKNGFSNCNNLVKK